MDELKANTNVRVPIRVYGRTETGEQTREEKLANGRIMARMGRGYDGIFTRDHAGQYIVEVGYGINPLRVMVLETEIEVVA
jgi:hypothetical protein